MWRRVGALLLATGCVSVGILLVSGASAELVHSNALRMQPAGARRLLSIEADDEMDGATTVVVVDGVQAGWRAWSAQQSSPAESRVELPRSPVQLKLPPPLPSRTVLPPALPPLPLPLNVLQQRLGARSPSLPPPLPMGKQCAPERHTACGCVGGTCECDLYPDYSHSMAYASTSPMRAPTRTNSGDDGVGDDERAVVPPLRALQFFNSNFGSASPSSTPKRAKRGRSLKDHATAPSLQVLCYCRCPSFQSAPR